MDSRFRGNDGQKSRSEILPRPARPTPALPEWCMPRRASTVMPMTEPRMALVEGADCPLAGALRRVRFYDVPFEPGRRFERRLLSALMVYRGCRGEARLRLGDEHHTLSSRS